MAKVKLTLEVEPELRCRIELSATARDESLREWVHRAILRELEAENRGEDGGEELTLPAEGAKPQGSENPPRPKGGGNPVSEALLDSGRRSLSAYNRGGEKRRGLIGATEAGRIVFVIYALHGGKIRPITANDATKAQKRRYGR